LKAIFRWELSLVAAALVALGLLVSAPVGTIYGNISSVTIVPTAVINGGTVTVTVVGEDDDGIFRVSLSDTDSTITIVSCSGAGAPIGGCSQAMDMDTVDGYIVDIDTESDSGVAWDADDVNDPLTVVFNLTGTCATVMELITVSGYQDATAGLDASDTIECLDPTPQIDITKAIVGAGGSYTFTFDGEDCWYRIGTGAPVFITAGGTFSLSDLQTAHFWCTDFAASAYSFDEQEGTSTVDVECTDENGSSSAEFDTTGVAIVTLNEEADFTHCTFTNTPATSPTTGTITIIKDVPGTTTDATIFDFTSTIASGSCLPDTDASAFTLDDNTSSVTPTTTETCSGVTAGSYTVTELAEPGYTTTVDCDDAGSTDTNPATIDLDAGETIICTFTNTPVVATPGTITIRKDAPGGTASDDFQFTWSNAGSCAPTTTPFTLSDGDSSTRACATAIAYTIDETSVDGDFEFTSITCTPTGSPTIVENEPGQSVTITLNAGTDAADCTFLNSLVSTTSNLTLTVEKDSEADSTSDVFDFDIDDSDTSGGCDDTSFVNLNPGDDDFTDCTVADDDTIIISEINIPDGWVLADITCRDVDITGGAGTNWDYDVDLSGEDVTVMILDITAFGPNAEIICNFDNDPTTTTGNITIVKDATGGTGSEVFDFDVTATSSHDCEGSFSLGDGDSEPLDCEVDVQYTITEDVPAGWDLTQISCVRDGGLASSAVVVQLSSDRVLITLGDSNDSVECTFHNTKTTTTTAGIPARTQAIATLATLGCNASELVNITVVDANGLAVANGTPVTVTASIGTVTPAVTQTSAGGAVVLYTAPASTGGVAILTAIAGGIVGQTQIVVNCTPAPTPTTPPPPPPPPPPPAADTGAGVIRPPSTGDAGLADSSGFGWQLSALALLAVSLTVAGVTLVARRAV